MADREGILTRMEREECPICGKAHRPLDDEESSPIRGFARIGGQSEVLARLKALGEFYTSKKEPPPHILLVGQEGMGKRTIAHAFAEEYGLEFHALEAGDFERSLDLSTVLSVVGPRTVVLISDVHRLRQPVRHLLSKALQRFEIDMIVGKGSGARAQVFCLERFTVIGTVPSERDCPLELRQLFPLLLALRKYSNSELERIAQVIAEASSLSISSRVAGLVARASGGSPRRVETLLGELARAGKAQITEDDVLKVFSVLGLKPQIASLSRDAAGIEHLSGIEFEQLVGSLLQRMGFRVEKTKASGDGGIDIVAVLEKPIVGGRYIIQCKRFASNQLVGGPVVREFYGAFTADQKAIKGIVITTSGFTDQAREFADNLPLELIDMSQLRSLLLEHGLIEAA